MRRIAVGMVALLVLVLGLAACNGDPEPTPTTSSQAAAPDSPSPEGPVDAPDGEYLYAAYGVRAEMAHEDGNTWAMKVENNTGHDLGKPSVYALDALDGHRIDATLEGAEPLADKQTQDVTVTWDEDFVPEDIGLVILVFGTDNFGNFSYGR